jgi:xylitol oxidase
VTTATTVGANWAGSHQYRARAVLHPAITEEIQRLVLRGTALRALGTRHSFSDIADTTGDLVCLDRFPSTIEIDGGDDGGDGTRLGNGDGSAPRRPSDSPRHPSVSFAAGLRYGDLAAQLQARGWAIHNLASLPHISVGGAIATGTHGSGDRNGSLATAVCAIEFVDGRGSVVRLARGDRDFDGAIVALGALGIVTRVSLDIEPTFDVRQDVYTGLPWSAAFDRFDRVTGSAYSVSLFTNWLEPTIGAVWLKSRMDASEPPLELLGARRQDTDRHMLPDQPASNTTQQGGLPGPWSDRLAHFRMGFTPSNGDELQSEYLLPRDAIRPALEALRAMGKRIEPLLRVTELRTIAADTLWLSGAFGRATVGIHFTWKNLPREVRALLPDVEAILLPLGARPHWGKVFTAGGDQLAPLYPRLDEFRALIRKYDPHGLFSNDFLARTIGR